MKNWRRLFLGAVSSALVILPAAPLSITLNQAFAEQQKESQGQGHQSGKSSQGSTTGPQGKTGEQQKGKSATGEPAAGGPGGEEKTGGSGPSGPQSLPPGGAPQFEGAKKGK